uniref:TPR_REGION domain-containing protein n=1 Tax=Rhabditophanes sp. KR3021 TaxID=114890 RepID=A0AC35TGJ3_9BILA
MDFNANANCHNQGHGLTHKKTNFDEMYRSAVINFVAHNYETSIEQCEKLLAVTGVEGAQKYGTKAMNCMAQCYWHLGELNDAWYWVGESLQLNWNELVEGYKSALEQEIEENRVLAKIANDEGVFEMERGNWEEALKYLNTAIKHDPVGGVIYLNKADCEMQLKNWRAGFLDYKAAFVLGQKSKEVKEARRFAHDQWKSKSSKLRRHPKKPLTPNVAN